MTWHARHISQTVQQTPSAIADYVGDPENLPAWAAGVSSGIRNEGGRWITDSPMGAVEIRFLGPVEYGILDHDVTLPDGTVVHNPMRVLRNEEGSEVVFTLYRHPGYSDETFEADAELIAADLKRLRVILEGSESLQS